MKKLIFSLLLICVAGAGWARGQAIDVKTHTLKNGMKILVNEDHSIPNVALYIFYKIGARNEKPGTTGLSHFFEHMMFNGAKKYGPGQFDRAMEASGGTNNAYTTRDDTVYEDWFPSSELELIFDLEADRIENLAFDPKIIESERGVVYSERRNSVDNNNFGILDEQLYADAFTAHPYQWPVLGWPSDIEGWKMADLRHHFEMGYSPSNAVMVVSGDVKFEEIVRLAEKYIEPIPSHQPPPPVTTLEPDQLGERRAKIEKSAQLPAITIGYHVPASNNPEYFALAILDSVLTTGESSRLYQRLVDKDELALEVNSDLELSFDPTLFTFVAQPRAGIAPEVVEKALYEELEKIKTNGITEQELQKAKNALLVGHYNRLSTIAGKANALGNYELFFGDYKKLLSAPEDYAKVTAEDVRKVAQKYFNGRNRTVVTLMPDGNAPEQSAPDQQGADE
jgi:zinc protease